MVLLMDILLILAVIAGAIGSTLFFVAYLMSMLTAFGNKNWIWGVALLVLHVLAVFPYCFTHSDVAAYPRGMLVRGLIAWGLAVIFAFAYYFSTQAMK
jgi:hypothetical protein